MRVAITGASGFIGNRIVEKFHLGKLHNVLPLVRSNPSLSVPSRFKLPWAICDCRSIDSLSLAIGGCEAVVHAAFGSPQVSRAIYLAAEKVGVRRLIVLSSASVYNQNPLIGTTEESPLPYKSNTPYNISKIASDKVFRRLRVRGKTEIVFLMPSVVYGPRSRWISNLADQIVNHNAYLINHGQGICNSVYVDNLVEAIRLALEAPKADGESFFISDFETITWEDFYRPVLCALGKNLEHVIYTEPQVFTTSIKEVFLSKVHAMAETSTAQLVKPRVPPAAMAMYKQVLHWLKSAPHANSENWLLDCKAMPEVALDMNFLQQCTYKLPNAKAERILGYRPLFSFQEGMKRSVDWLRFAGYI